MKKVTAAAKAFLASPEIRRFVQYVVVGGIVFWIHTGALWLLKRIAGLSNPIAVALGFTIGAISHFLLNNLSTFRHSPSSLKKRIAGHAAVAFFNLLLTTAVGTLVLTYIIDNVLVSTIASTLVTTFFGFFLLDRFVFYTKCVNMFV
jgi:putative flippase GtrA